MLRNRSRRSCSTEMTNAKNGGGLEVSQVDYGFMASVISAPRLAKPSVIPTLIEPCDDANSWSATRCVKSNDTVNCVCGAGAVQSIKAIPNSGTDCSITRVLGSAANLAACHMFVRFYINPLAYTGLKKIYMYVMSSGTDFIGYRLWDVTGIERATHPGWNEWSGTQSLTDVVGGTLNWGAVTQVRIRLEYDAAAVPEVTVDEIRFVPKLTKPKYCFTFDDGWADQYAAQAYLLSRGMVGTFYVVPTIVGTSGYLTLDQLKRMRDAGHLIANHTYNHVWYGLSDDRKKEEICLAADWLCKNGFSDGARIFAAPVGQWTPSDNNLIRDRYLQSVRGTWNPGYKMIPQTLLNRSLFYGSSQNDSTAASTMLTNAITDGAVVIPFWHYWLAATEGTLAAFKTHVDAVAVQRDAGNIDVVTMSDLLSA